MKKQFLYALALMLFFGLFLACESETGGEDNDKQDPSQDDDDDDNNDSEEDKQDDDDNDTEGSDNDDDNTSGNDDDNPVGSDDDDNPITDDDEDNTPPPAIEIGEFEQSPCKNERGLNDPTKISAVYLKPSVFVLVYDLEENCCTLFESKAELEDGSNTLNVRFYHGEDSTVCRCICDFDLTAEVKGLAAGTYSIKVFAGETGETLIGETSIEFVD